MPFKSEAQRKYLWANHPEIAKRWTNEHGSAISGSPVARTSEDSHRQEALKKRINASTRM